MTQKKPMLIRLEKEIWVFVKKKAIDREISANELINDCLRKYKIKCEKKLTDSDIVIP